MEVNWNLIPSPNLNGSIQKSTVMSTVMGLPAIRMPVRRRTSHRIWSAGAVLATFCLYYTMRIGPSWRHHRLIAAETAIPMMIHQLFFDDGSSTRKPVPDQSVVNAGASLRIWDEESCAQLAQSISTRYALAWDRAELPASRLNFCRFLILYEHGGLYLDLDVHLSEPLPWKQMGKPHTKFPHAEGNLGSEPLSERAPGLIMAMEQASTQDTNLNPEDLRFTQWSMAAAPKHAVIRSALDEASDGILATEALSGEESSKTDTHSRGGAGRMASRTQNHDASAPPFSFPPNSTTSDDNNQVDQAFSSALSHAVVDTMGRELLAAMLAATGLAGWRHEDLLVLPSTAFVQGAEHVLADIKQTMRPEEMHGILAVKHMPVAVAGKTRL